VTRLGGNRPVPVEARVVAATHRDLEAEVAAGRFRQDLYFRISVHVLQVPPLRDRLSDVPELAAGFVAATCERFRIKPKKLSGDAMDLLLAYDWRRNNVRELRNVLERMIIAADGDILRPEHVPLEIQEESGASRPASAAQGFQALKIEAERQIVVSALERHDWHITRTAEDLGLADHASLLKIMRRLGLKRE
jgi:DNA-binding NtrC family response regulator